MRASKDAVSLFSTRCSRRYRAWLTGARTGHVRGPEVLLVDQAFPGKQRIIEAELSEVANPAGIEDSIQMVDLVLHHPGVKIFHAAIDGVSGGVETGIPQFAIPGHQAAHAGNR